MNVEIQILLVGIVIILLLFVWYNNYKKDKSVHNDESKYVSVRILIRQTARWALAATQDQNIIIALLHANYATGYLWALKDIATDHEIQNITGIDMKKFTNQIVKIQDDTTKRIVDMCSNLAPSNIYLAQIAGEA